jgi:hypothetical protein
VVGIRIVVFEKDRKVLEVPYFHAYVESKSQGMLTTDWKKIVCCTIGVLQLCSRQVRAVIQWTLFLAAFFEFFV